MCIDSMHTYVHTVFVYVCTVYICAFIFICVYVHIVYIRKGVKTVYMHTCVCRGVSLISECIALISTKHGTPVDRLEPIYKRIKGFTC